MCAAGRHGQCGDRKVLYYQEFTCQWTAHSREGSMWLGRAERGMEPLDPLFTQLHVGEGRWAGCAPAVGLEKDCTAP